MKHFMPALRIKIFFMILLGLAYPLFMTGIAQGIFPKQSGGDFLTRGGQVIGAAEIAQKFEKPNYFWSRPSAVDFNPLPSGGSNLGQASQDLKKMVDERRSKLKAAHPSQTGEPPQDLLFASGSGLDPDISPAAAEYQVKRVATARSLKEDVVRNLVAKESRGPQFGILGDPTVNVLALNLALDKEQGISTAPVLIPVVPAASVPEAPATPAVPPAGPSQTK